MNTADIPVQVKGKLTDNHTRCEHYHGALDVIAIKFRCCNEYYPCYYCHHETASHEAGLWNKNEFDTPVILCGMCGAELTINEYKSCNYKCPSCQAAFNPRCYTHNHFYFEE